MLIATYCAPDLITFCGLQDLGPTATGQHLTATRAVTECRVVDDDNFCHRCGAQGTAHDKRSAGCLMRRSGGGPPPWLSGCAAISAPPASTYGRKTPHWSPNRKRRFPAEGGRGFERHRVPALEHRPGRRGAGCFVEHREHCGAGRRATGADQQPDPFRRSQRDRD